MVKEGGTLNQIRGKGGGSGQICPLLPPPSTLENRGGRPGRRRRSAGGPGPRGWPGRGGNEGGRRGRMIPPSDLGKRWPAEAAPRRRVAVDGGEHGGGATERGGGREVRGNGEGIEKARVPYLAWARAQRGRVLRDGQRRQRRAAVLEVAVGRWGSEEVVRRWRWSSGRALRGLL